jgi:hypothetical protein
MRSASPRSVLVLLLFVVVFVVFFADLFALSASADSGAVLSPVSPSSLSRDFSHSYFRMSRLVDGSGRPIVGGSIEVLQRVVGDSRMVLVSSAVTRSDGSFTATVPLGPSRLVDLAYRGAGLGSGYVAQTLVFEHVSAGLRLRITPRRTSPTGTVTFDGQVLGVVPSHGIVVEVLVYYLGAWQPIRTPRTSGAGGFRVTYRFHRARGVFPFRLRVRDGQVGLPHGEACSDWVGVVV